MVGRIGDALYWLSIAVAIIFLFTGILSYQYETLLGSVIISIGIILVGKLLKYVLKGK